MWISKWRENRRKKKRAARLRAIIDRIVTEDRELLDRLAKWD